MNGLSMANLGPGLGSRANIGDLILENVREMCTFFTNGGAGEDELSEDGQRQNWLKIW
jgi:hypothetical protein